jgi:hypothetical protein
MLPMLLLVLSPTLLLCVALSDRSRPLGSELTQQLTRRPARSFRSLLVDAVAGRLARFGAYLATDAVGGGMRGGRCRVAPIPIRCRRASRGCLCAQRNPFGVSPTAPSAAHSPSHGSAVLIWPAREKQTYRGVSRSVRPTGLAASPQTSRASPWWLSVVDAHGDQRTLTGGGGGASRCFF